MLRAIAIENFKGLAHLKLNDLGQITILGGKNNVGKTSVLEAAFLALDRSNPQLFVKELLWRNVESVPLNEGMWLPFFKDMDSTKKLRVSLTTKSGRLQTFEASKYQGAPSSFAIQANNGARIQNGSISPHDAGVQSFGDSLSIRVTANGKPIQDSVLRTSPNQFGMEHKQFAEQESISARALFRSLPQSDETEIFTRIDGRGQAEYVLQAIRQIDERATDISVGVENGQPRLFVKIDGLNRKLPLTLLGDGTRRIVSIVLSVLDSEDSVIFIDEIENGIHYTKLESMWKAICVATDLSRSQVIATTHSHECLSAAQRASSDHDSALVYVRLQRSKQDGNITSERYTDSDLADAIAAEVEVR